MVDLRILQATPTLILDRAVIPPMIPPMIPVVGLVVTLVKRDLAMLPATMVDLEVRGALVVNPLITGVRAVSQPVAGVRVAGAASVPKSRLWRMLR